jgi:hypothetical protein
VNFNLISQAASVINHELLYSIIHY